MFFDSLETAARQAAAGSAATTAILMCESAFLVPETVDRLRSAGFARILAIGPGAEAAPNAEGVFAASANVAEAEARTSALNHAIAALAGRWTLLLHNGEFLFYPYSETRTIRDFTDFLGWERRPAAAAYAIDLYSDALGRDESAFSLDDVYFDSQGWYGFERDGQQAEVFGGLGWRFEEYTPRGMARVNRPALFFADQEVRIRPDLWFEDDDYNAISCPWHNNPTMALMSVRRAAALRRHPNFSQGVKTLMWPGSERFEWRADQLLRHGMIEPGQWL